MDNGWNKIKTENILIKKVKQDGIFALSLLFGVIVQLRYVYTVCVNVPLMDYWKYINMFVEKIYTNTLTLSDIWQNDGIHRSPLQFVYFILNVKLFHLDSRVELYLGVILMMVTIILLYTSLKKDVWVGEKKRGIFFSGIALVVIVYNLNQYEILSEQFSLSFASRMILFLVSFILTSRLLVYLGKVNYVKAFCLGCFYVIVIVSASGGYFPAYVASIAFVIVLDFCIKGEERRKYIGTYAILILFLLLGTILYLFGMFQGISTVDSTNIGVLDFIRSFVTGVITMLGVSIIGFEAGNIMTMFVGGCILGLYVISFIVYFKKRYYKITYIPVLLYGYTMGAMGLIFLGRLDLYGNDYAYASRYVYETNVAHVGFLWIATLYCMKLEGEHKNKKLEYLKKSVACLSMIFLLAGIAFSNYKEWAIAPYRKIYCEDLIVSIEHVDTLTSDEFKAFQADEQVVRSGIELMKRYQLGIYSEIR